MSGVPRAKLIADLGHDLKHSIANEIIVSQKRYGRYDASNWNGVVCWRAPNIDHGQFWMRVNKAGLVSKGKAKQIHHDKSNQKKVERQTGTESIDEARLAALEVQKKNAERARELNAQRDAAAA